MIDPPNHRMKRRLDFVRLFSIPLLAGIAAVFVISYVASFNAVTVFDGVQSRSVRTQEKKVEGVLRDAGIMLRGEDIVQPSLDAEIRHQEFITVTRARMVRVSVAGQQLQMVRTQRENARDLLEDIGYPLGTFDALRVNGEFIDRLPDKPAKDLPSSSSAAQRPLSKDVPIADVEVLRAVPVFVQEGDQPAIEIQTIAQTVGEALLQAGKVMYMADRVEPSLGTHLVSGMTIRIVRAKSVTIWMDGTPLQTRSHARTVAELLSSMRIMLLENDYAQPGLNEPIREGSEVRVVRVTRELQIRQEPIDFETYWQPNSELELDVETLSQEGAPGVRELQDHVVFEDGREVSRNQVVDRVVREVQNRIYDYGTKIVVRELATPSGPLQYWRKMRAFATSYSASTSGVSRSASYYGIARCGQAMRRGIVAVDPRVIPLGTMVYVEGYGIGFACDTGSAVIGKRIDLGYGDNDLEHWYRSVDVYILTPVPLNPRYRLN